jgi:hypothetical protein
MTSTIDELEIACKNAISAYKSEIKDMEEQYCSLVKMLDYEHKERIDTEDKLFSLEDENKKLREILKTRYTLREVDEIYMHALMCYKPRKEPYIGSATDRFKKYNKLCGRN